jgi:PAS domain-containing protein
MEVNALALSLTKTVNELEQRIVEGELMAAALRESERKYRAIFENASIGICQISTRNEWLNANRILAGILGFRDVIELLASQPDFHGNLFTDAAQRQTLIQEMLDCDWSSDVCSSDLGEMASCGSDREYFGSVGGEDARPRNAGGRLKRAGNPQ